MLNRSLNFLPQLALLTAVRSSGNGTRQSFDVEGKSSCRPSSSWNSIATRRGLLWGLANLEINLALEKSKVNCE